MIQKLQKIADQELLNLLAKPELWNTLDVNYYPPRVERLWLQYNDKLRLFMP